jgi:hypothetical protein
MNWAWATSLDQIWHSPAFSMWLTLAAAGFFGLIVLITLVRAERSVANGALTVITLLAIGIAVASTIRGFGPASGAATTESRAAASAAPSLPVLSCIDNLAGEVVGAACEKAVFGSPEVTAAAVNYTASLVTRLTALGDVSTAKPNMTTEMLAIRRALERDRYGLVAQVLTARDGCTQTQCPAFRSLMDSRQVAANMNDRVYELLVGRYSPSWNAPPPAAVPVAGLPPSAPTGRPTNAEFPSSANTPAVSIMTPEPGTGSSPGGQRPAASAAAKQPPAVAAAPAATTTSPPASAMASAKKQPAAKQRPSAPTSIAPAATAPAQAPAAND